MATEKTIKLDAKTEAVFKRKGYSIEKMLNEGAFGQVYKGANKKTGELVAIKVMDLNAVGEKFKTKFLPRELDALMDIKHDNVIYIHDIIRANNKIYIFMEFANGGDVTGYLTKSGAMPEPLACYWFTQTTRAIHYIHTEIKMAHRDIKIDNILLHNNVAKVTDFGFAKKCWDEARGCNTMSETFCGTEPYYSPQIVARQKYDPYAADSWAMGVTLFCMLNNRFPYHFADSKEMLKEQKDPKFLAPRYIRDFPADLHSLMSAFFTVPEAGRINMADTLKHPWILRKGKGNIYKPNLST